MGLSPEYLITSYRGSTFCRCHDHNISHLMREFQTDATLLEMIQGCDNGGRVNNSSNISFFSAKADTNNCKPIAIPGTIWRNRGLLATLTVQELRSRYTGSLLGLAWMLVIPLVQLAIYTFVFGYIYRVGQNGGGILDYALILFSGFVPFIMVSESLGSAPSRITSQPNFVKKVVFPLEILPLVTMCVAVIHAFGAFIILLLAACLFGDGLHVTIFWLPLIVIAPILQVIGLSWILSSLGVFVRDLTSTIQLIIQFLFFLTPITYPLSFVPAKVLMIYKLNPLVGTIENFRRIILHGKEPVFIDIFYPLVVGFILIVSGYYCFQRCRRAFADVL